MRPVMYSDEQGYLHRALIKDEDPDSMAEYGIPTDPPSVERLDVDGLKRDLHNAMVKGELYTLQDVMRQANGLLPLINIFKRHIFALYEQELNEIIEEQSLGG